ncbi:MAG: PadR family transcriptional regulator [Oscillospiraceae bacterium]|nr:PadR family transcriptional regulator [Oscillospiraceae bacterium]
MSIASDMLRGNTDMIVLAHLLHRESYGYQINKHIQEKSGGRFELKEATLYGAFRRLEEAGCVSFYWGDEQTGARRRYYRITTAGRETFAQSVGEWREAIDLIEKLIDQKEEEKENGR